MTEKEEPGQLVGFEKMAQRILESFEKRMEQFILQAVKKSQGTVYNLEGANLRNCAFNGSITNNGSENYNHELKEERTCTTNTHKEAIMNYVDRLKPIVKAEYQSRYEELWDELLELHEVKLQVYDKGKQQDTTFNRNLVAQIIHMMKDKLYLSSVNAAQMAEHLEPGKGVAHSVRQKLGEDPKAPIRRSVNEFLIENL